MSAPGGVLVGGEPVALLAASSALHEVAYRTDDIGRALAGALAPAASTIVGAAPYAPGQAAAVLAALEAVLASPGAGLATVAAAFEKAALELRAAGQALEAAGAVGLLASGGLGLLRGRRPTVLASTDGVDLRREAFAGSWSVGEGGGSSSLGVREVRRPDGSSFFVVELTTGGKYAASLGVHVNGVGGFVEAAAGTEVSVRWAVPTKGDAELLVALAAAALIPGARARLLASLPPPTEAAAATTGSATLAGSVAAIPGTSAAASLVTRSEVTAIASGGQRLSATISGAGQLALVGAVGTAGAGAVRVAVDRSAAGVVTKLSVSATTEADRGRHGSPLVEAGNREATLVEREWDVALTPEHRAAADRIAAAVAHGGVPDRSDVAEVAAAAREAQATEHTYDVRHQAGSADVSLEVVGAGGGAAIDTAELRR